MEGRLWFLGIILLAGFVVFYSIHRYGMKKGTPATASGAIVMAFGIFMNGAVYEFSLLGRLALYFAVCLFLSWLFIAASFIRLAWKKELVTRHFTDPIRTFAVGTWVAGTSVCFTVVIHHFPEFHWMARGIGVLTVFLWMYYIKLSVVNFKRLFTSDLYRKAHGVILLSTVSTQSLVILHKTLYGGRIASWIYLGFIILGFIFYAAGFYLIAKKYVLKKNWNITDEWPNANCILHGAMSITGLACVITGAVSENMTLLIWLWVLLWFAIVESAEGWRAFLRIRKYGIHQGVGLYHISQWSRNFTFGMLYAFTYTFDLDHTFLANSALFHTIRNGILNYGAWVVAAVLANELLLFMAAKIKIKGLDVSRVKVSNWL